MEIALDCQSNGWQRARHLWSASSSSGVSVAVCCYCSCLALSLTLSPCQSIGITHSSSLLPPITVTHPPTMAKNTSSSQFRKIDVDQFGDDVFKEEDQGDTSSPASLTLDEKEVSNLLNAGKQKDALKLALNSAPVCSKSQSAREANFNLVLKILLSIRISEIEAVVNELNFDEIDILMKYIYRGFETPTDGSSAHLLVWHDKAFSKGGESNLGSIIRVLTDKKRV